MINEMAKLASNKLKRIMNYTPLEYNNRLSDKYRANIYNKREDQTPVRSFKIRGAYNKISNIQSSSIVTCSAGNHAQGVAYSCSLLNIKGDIFMPIITPRQKIESVKKFGKDNITIHLVGNDFDESLTIAKQHCKVTNNLFIHPFDDNDIIYGQSTIGLEIYEQFNGQYQNGQKGQKGQKEEEKIDYVILTIGGGGMAAGVSSILKYLSPTTKIIGVQPLGAPSMKVSFMQNKNIKLNRISSFVDGAAVKQPGCLTYPICKELVSDIILVDEKEVCSKILDVYNNDGIIIEPAGILSLCALDKIKNLRDKNIVCIISGGNSDVYRIPDFIRKSI